MILRSKDNKVFKTTSAALFDKRSETEVATINDIDDVDDFMAEIGESDINPSLALTANGSFKEGKLLSVLPFSGDGDFPVAGGGNAVSQRSDGTWQINWPANTPRFSWIDGVPSILVESQRQNLITYPRSFDNAYWTLEGISINNNAGAGYACPFVNSSGVNTNEGMKLVENETNSYKNIRKGSFPIGAYTLSVYAKKAERKYLYISTHGSVGVQSRGAYFDLDTKIVDFAAEGIVAKITHLVEDWCLCEIDVSNAASVSSVFTIGMLNDNKNLVYTGDGTSGIYICHAQFELGASARSPIYGTEGSALTRNADVISKTGVAGLIGQTEGTIVQYLNVDHNRNCDTMTIQSEVSTQRDIAFGILSNQISARFRWYDGITNQSYVVQTPIPSTGRIYKIGISYKNNEVFVCVNGVQIGVTYTENWSITTGTLITISIGSSSFAFGNNPYNNSNVIISKTAISLEQLQALTTL